MNRRNFLSGLAALPLFGAFKNQAVPDGTRGSCEFCGRPIKERPPEPINEGGTFGFVGAGRDEYGPHPEYRINYPEGVWVTCVYAMGDFVRANVKGRWQT